MPNSLQTQLLQLSRVALGYDAPNILTDVNFSLASGECVALVGQNGVGKSSLFHAIMGLMPKVTGDITFDNQDITRLETHEIARLGIGLVKQENSIFGDLTIREHFRLLNTRNLDENLLHFPDLLPKAKSKAKSLSGGQRQQLAIALALANSPKLLLLDEPSANIQPSVVESMIEALTRINADKQITFLVAEQNLSVIRHLTQHAYLINTGKLDTMPIAIDATMTERELAEKLSEKAHEVPS